MLLATWLRAGNWQVVRIWESHVLLASWLRAGNLASCLRVGHSRESCELAACCLHVGCVLAACGTVAVKVRVGCVRKVSAGSAQPVMCWLP